MYIRDLPTLQSSRIERDWLSPFRKLVPLLRRARVGAVRVALRRIIDCTPLMLSKRLRFMSLLNSLKSCN